jgi:hypothetical protein
MKKQQTEAQQLLSSHEKFSYESILHLRSNAIQTDCKLKTGKLTKRHKNILFIDTFCNFFCKVNIFEKMVHKIYFNKNSWQSKFISVCLKTINFFFSQEIQFILQINLKVNYYFVFLQIRYESFLKFLETKNMMFIINSSKSKVSIKPKCGFFFVFLLLYAQFWHINVAFFMM